MICLAGYSLAKTYFDKDTEIKVLQRVDLEVEEGSLVCIEGKSGCGKSTLLHILGLLDEPDSGRILLDGNEVSARHPGAPAIRNRLIGFVFQFHYLIDDLTAQENVALPMLICGSGKTEALNRAAELLRQLDLADRLRHYPNQLSGGEQQRLALARALINRPRIILADEPTGNLDPQHSQEVWSLFCRLNKELGQTFVIVTHEPELARKSDRQYELKDGILT